jgi:hypothetical protein
MASDRVIVDFDTAEEAKKVEETVKTGYAETTIENILQWIAVEGDLVSTYGRLAEGRKDAQTQGAYSELRDESNANLAELSRLLKSFESLDRARIRRIELLGSLTP